MKNDLKIVEKTNTARIFDLAPSYFLGTGPCFPYSPVYSTFSWSSLVEFPTGVFPFLREEDDDVDAPSAAAAFCTYDAVAGFKRLTRGWPPQVKRTKGLSRGSPSPDLRSRPPITWGCAGSKCTPCKHAYAANKA